MGNVAILAYAYTAGTRAWTIGPSGPERLLSEEVAALPAESEFLGWYRKLPLVSTMKTFLLQLRAATEAIFGLLLSGGFMLVWLAWLCCWPVYRLFRSHTIRS